MASVVLVSPSNVDIPVSSITAFDRLIYGYGYRPKTGSIDANRATVLFDAPPPSPDPAELVRLGDLQQADSDARKELGAAFVPFWAANQAVTTGLVRVDPSGHLITANSSRTTRASYDATEQAAWAPTADAAGAAAAAQAAAIAAIPAVPSASTVGVFYVDPTNGNNAHDGRSWQTAVATIAQALTLCANQSQIGEIRLGRGVHNVTATLVIPQAVKVEGMGPLISQETEIVWTGADDGSYVIRTAGDTSTNDFSQGRIGNFMVRCNATKPGGGAYTNVNGIYARNLQNAARLHDIRVQNMPGKGLYADAANGGVPITGFPGWTTFERLWMTGNNINWHIRSAFTSLLFNMCAGDVSTNTTDVFIIDPMTTDTFGGRSGNMVFVGFKSEDNGGSTADANYFTVNTDVAMSFLGCSAKKSNPGTKPWVNYTAAPASLNRVPNTVPVSFTNCHISNLPSALVDPTGTVLLKPAKTSGGESFQIPLWPSELFPTFHATKADDRFVRADSASVLGATELGAKAWSADAGTWGISGNQAYCVASTANAQATIDAGVADCTVEVTLGATASAAQLIVRKTDANNYLYWSGGGSFFKVVAGTQTNLGNPGAFVAGDVLKVVMKGTSVWCYRNGQLAQVPITITEQSTATKHGLGANSITTPRFDRFTVTV